MRAQPWAQRSGARLPRVFGLYRQRVHHGKQTQQYRSLNFSCILEGDGWYRRDGHLHPVQAPAIFRQHPGSAMAYGPQASWLECSIIYLHEEETPLREAGVLPWPEAVLPIPPARQQQFFACWDLLQSLRAQAMASGSSIDAIALGALLLVRNSQAAMVTPDLERVRVQLAVLDRAVPRLADLARDCGWSLASLRRRWQQAYGCPPLEYAFRLKTQRACELLAGSDLPIHQVARAVGFHDPLYFSKWFARRSGMAPTAYRESAGSGA